MPLAALDILTELFFEDLAELEENEDFSGTAMCGFLPEKNHYRYTVGFARRFFVCFMVVGWKLFSVRREELCCLAEELALNALIEQAESLLEIEGVSADFSSLYDAAFQDLDFEILFQEELDGFEETAAGRVMGMGFLRFDEWFKQFNNTGPVHPFCVDAP